MKFYIEYFDGRHTVDVKKHWWSRRVRIFDSPKGSNVDVNTFIRNWVFQNSDVKIHFKSSVLDKWS